MMGLQGSSAAVAPVSDPVSMAAASSRAFGRKRLAGRMPLFLEIRHDICGLALRIVETFLDEGVGLLFQYLDVELRAA